MGSVSEEVCVLVTIDETLKFVWGRKILACSPVWVWGCLGESSVEICDSEAPQGMLPPRQKLPAWQPFRADQILVSETKITWKSAYPLWFCPEGRADNGELGQFVETPASSSNITALPIFTRGQTSDLPGLEDSRRREYLAQEGEMFVHPNPCSVHRAAWPGGFSHMSSSSSCFVQEMHKVNMRKCSSSQGLWVSWSPGHS